MTDAVTVTACMADGRPLEVMERLIRLRSQELAETTSEAVTATAINILKSVRAATKVASVNGTKFGVFVSERTDLKAGFVRDGSGAKPRRCIRMNGGHHLTGVKILNLMGNYIRGEKPRVFLLLISYAKDPKNAKNSDFARYYAIASHKPQVEDVAHEMVKRRIRTYSGMARWTIGQAMSRVSQQGASSSEGLTGKAKRVGASHLSVNVAANGFSSGQYSVEVIDSLDYSVEAMGGASAFDAILMKASNKTAGIINHFCQHERWNTEQIVRAPFPELVGK